MKSYSVEKIKKPTDTRDANRKDIMTDNPNNSYIAETKSQLVIVLN